MTSSARISAPTDQPLSVVARRRLVGTTIDVLLCFVLSFDLPYPFGAGFAIWYLARAATWERGSLGHRVMGLQPRGDDGEPVGTKAAFWRGLPWITVLTVALLPVVGDELAMTLLMVLWSVEAWLWVRGWRRGLLDLISASGLRLLR